jgi:hypothetical protein
MLRGLIAARHIAETDAKAVPRVDRRDIEYVHLVSPVPLQYMFPHETEQYFACFLFSRKLPVGWTRTCYASTTRICIKVPLMIVSQVSASVTCAVITATALKMTKCSRQEHHRSCSQAER